MAERGDWLRFLEQSVWEEARNQNPDGTLWGREEVVEFVFDPTGHGKGLNVRGWVERAGRNCHRVTGSRGSGGEEGGHAEKRTGRRGGQFLQTRNGGGWSDLPLWESPGERRKFSKAAGREGAEMSLVPRTAHGSALVMRVWKRETAEPK